MFSKKQKLFTYEEFLKLLDFSERDEFKVPIEMQLWVKQCILDYKEYIHKV